MPHALTLLVAYLLGVLAVARGTRLIVADHYPPVERLRIWWWQQTTAKGGWRSGWSLLVSGRDGEGGCPFCLAPYLTAVALTWVILAGIWTPDTGTWAGWWWIGAVWASASYLSAMVVVRDEPPAE